MLQLSSMCCSEFFMLRKWLTLLLFSPLSRFTGIFLLHSTSLQQLNFNFNTCECVTVQPFQRLSTSEYPLTMCSVSGTGWEGVTQCAQLLVLYLSHCRYFLQISVHQYLKCLSCCCMYRDIRQIVMLTSV